MRTLRLPVVSVALLLAVLAALLASPAADAQGGRFDFLRTTLSGAEEVLGGDPDAIGFAAIRIDRATGEICYVAVGARIEPATAAHIHVGSAGEAGPPVLTLEQAGPHIFVGCATDPALAEALVAAPEDYYVNIHNEPFQDGALRGQLG